MSVLKAFLNPEPINKTKKVIISKRFKDENGDVVPFVIKNINQDENDALRRKATRLSALNSPNGRSKEFDSAKYTALMIVACTVEPKFSDAELCEAYKTMDPCEVPQKMLTPGEFAKLSQAILDINDFDDDADALADEAKN
jgi:Fe-S-cluster formation regulator IscX/YfhJ